MARKGTKYHIVFSPQNKFSSVRKFDLLESYIKSNSKLYTISTEYGNNDNKHLDIVCELKKEIRCDKMTEKLRDLLDISKENLAEYKHGIKCYVIEEDKWLWYIGYNMKEEKGNYNNLDKKEIKEGRKEYEKNKDLNKKKIVEMKRWTKDKIVMEYINMVSEKRLKHDRKLLRDFIRLHKHKITLSQYSKLLDDKYLDEYICDIWEIEHNTYGEQLLVGDHNVLGLDLS